MMGPEYETDSEDSCNRLMRLIKIGTYDEMKPTDVRAIKDICRHVSRVREIAFGVDTEGGYVDGEVEDELLDFANTAAEFGPI